MAIKLKIMNKNLKNQLESLLGESVNYSLKTNELKINTQKELKMHQLKELIFICNRYNLEFSIKRSGAGLKIEFTKAEPAEH